MHKLLKEHYIQIERTLVKHRVKKFEAFGSIVHGNFSNKSDIDFLVSFQPIPIKEFADNFFSLEEELQAILGRDIDLLILKDIKNAYFLSSISNQRIVVYECR